MLSFRQYLIENLPSDFRPDGTKKGPGWLGTFKNKEGADVSEYSISVPTDEIEQMNLPKGAILRKSQTLIPSMVPTLSDEERDSVIAATETGDSPPDAVVGKAFQHAQDRIRQGKSTFITDKDKFKDNLDNF